MPPLSLKDQKDTTPSCFNCKGPHHVTYRGCSKVPQKPGSKSHSNHQRSKTQSTSGSHNPSVPFREPSPPPPNLPSPQSIPNLSKPQRSYASAVSPDPSPQTLNQGQLSPIPDPSHNPQLQQLFREFLSIFTAALQLLNA